MRFQEVEHAAQHHLDTFNNGFTVASTAGSFNRAFQIVDDRQQLAQEIFALQADRFVALLANTLARVFALGERAQVSILEFGEFLILISDLRLQFLDYGIGPFHRRRASSRTLLRQVNVSMLKAWGNSSELFVLPRTADPGENNFSGARIASCRTGCPTTPYRGGSAARARLHLSSRRVRAGPLGAPRCYRTSASDEGSPPDSGPANDGFAAMDRSPYRRSSTRRPD